MSRNMFKLCVQTFKFIFLNLFSKVPGGLRLGATVINRPGVAGAAFHTPLSLINSIIK